MASLKENYFDAVIRVARSIFLIVCAFSLFWTFLACIDVAFALRWGYTLASIPIGLGTATAAYFGSILIKWIGKIIRGIGRN